MVLGRLSSSSRKDGKPASLPSNTATDATAIKGSGTKNISAASPLERDNWADDLLDNDHVQFFKSVDWGKTLLGPLEGWSTAQRIHTFTTMADSRPACLYWGPNRVAIYNEAFVPLAGKRHPILMGTTFAENFSEIWEAFQQVFNAAEITGKAIDVNEMELFVERSGFLEETFFTGNFIPLRGSTGKVDGFYNAVHEVSSIKIRDRRRSTINAMQVPSGLVNDPFASYVIPFLEMNGRDIPMAILYEVDEEIVPGRTSLLLRGRIGVPDNHSLASAELNFNGSEGIVPLLRKAKEGILTIPINKHFDGLEWAGFGEPSKHISLLPLTPSGRLFGFLVIGTNPRQAVDEHHHQFMRDLAAKVSHIAASLVSADEIRKRAVRLEKELADSERQIRYMAQHASVGMQHLSIDGTTMWANEQYYKMTGHPRGEKLQYKLSFLDVIADEDRAKALDCWNLLLKGEPNVSAEIHLKRMFTPPTGDPEPACMLYLSFPYSEDGKVKSIMTCTTDVSSLKWAESSEARNAADAREAKRQQEEFIDLVSHELRNPLSAIFQLADTIITSFPEGETVGTPVDEPLQEALRSNVEAASTILMCAKHQKRIVDDVLTLSKLEYMMLAIAPRPVQLPKLIDRSVRMFDADMVEADVEVTTISEPSLEECQIDWVMCDPSRITQIFINLLTNAIKFTKSEDTRQITIKYGATLSEPRNSFPEGLNWAPNQKQMDDLPLNPEWGLGETLYVTLTVTDTGVGMTPEQIKKLFSRFQQASARTSIKYGGSGLGLFISQKLTEKLGGEIGVLSEPGKGSTFAFYVKARRTTKDKKASAIPTTRPAITGRSLPSPVSVGIPEVDLNKMHVLLVEDNQVNQQVLRRQLTNSGCIVSVANHGGEALKFLEKTNAWYERIDTCKHIDIVLMDWEMPVMDGLTASREIRALQKQGKITRHLEIIATTANAREEQIESALASGIDAVMPKPFRVADLMEKMRERLSMTVARHTSPRIWTSP